jgi:hypothetical protein
VGEGKAKGKGQNAKGWVGCGLVLSRHDGGAGVRLGARGLNHEGAKARRRIAKSRKWEFLGSFGKRCKGSTDASGFVLRGGDRAGIGVCRSADPMACLAVGPSRRSLRASWASYSFWWCCAFALKIRLGGGQMSGFCWGFRAKFFSFFLSGCCAQRGYMRSNRCEVDRANDWPLRLGDVAPGAGRSEVFGCGRREDFPGVAACGGRREMVVRRWPRSLPCTLPKSF